jgi:peptidoglycan hydrolase-like protein with peptidoglycan-binding domain
LLLWSGDDLGGRSSHLKEAAMKTWSNALALFVAGAMLAGTAHAQTKAPGTEAPKGTETPTGATGKPDAMKSDTKSDPAMKSARSGRMSGSKGEQVKAAQQALKDKGHDPGTIDGVVGPKTQAALRDFQSKEGLKATGRLDSETMAKLGVDAKTGAATPSAAPSASPPTGASGKK